MQVSREAWIETTFGITCVFVQSLSNCESLMQLLAGVGVGVGEGEGEGEGAGCGALPIGPVPSSPPQAAKDRSAAKAEITGFLRRARSSIDCNLSLKGARVPFAAFISSIPSRTLATLMPRHAILSIGLK